MRLFLFVLLLLPVFVACSDDPSEPQEGVGRTVIVYLGVDNNFAGEGAEKIKVLTENWKGSYNGNLLVYADAGRAVLVHIYENKSGRRMADTIQEYGSENSADPVVLKRVLSEVKEQFPADSYGMIVLSHGSGWLPQGQLTAPASIIQDRRSEMELGDFVEAIPMPLDFIIFDACFMGTIEVAYELKEKVKYVVASPAEVLAPGFVYENIVGHLMKDEPDLVAVAKDFYEYYDGLSDFWRSATVSVVKTEGLDEVAACFREIGDMEDAEGMDLSQIQNYGYASHILFTDIGDYVSHWSPKCYEQFMKKLNEAVVYKAHTPGYYSSGNMAYNAINAYSGLALYVPQVYYPFLNEEFQKLKWVRAISR
ncbi:clostripain-related cysteine peptidase [Odoribacter lunatus]|uniref:clostripain-related cysteine peptidase n=1 Tax=Odoribacter lunatus TaxID=2941335 RepID=UPI00203C566C|nr:clostripain-related cysteine peptidase [Odoribacter lunatus]